MKNLPDEFPIRYALITGDIGDSEEDSAKRTAAEESLFRQLLFLIQKEALTEELLNLSYSSIDVRLHGQQIADIARLSAPQSWINEASEYFKKLLPEATFNSTLGTGFLVGLYSYRGALERPIFLQSYNNRTNRDFLSKKIGYYGSSSSITWAYELHQRINAGQLDDWELYKSKSRYDDAIYINIPFSPIWELLDQGAMDGIFPHSTSGNNRTESIKNLFKMLPPIAPDKKITVAVCRNWQSLFFEELRVLHTSVRFCQNCQKALPMGYRGKYCSDDSACLRARARIRKSQSRL